MHKTLLMLSCLVVMLGCVPMPDIESSMSGMYNVPSHGVSQFDGTKYVRVTNMRCGSVMFELYQDTPKSKAGIVLLKAGSVSIDNIGEGKSLLIKLDGKVYSFESNDSMTEHESIPTGPVGYRTTMAYSHKSYVVPEAVVREAAASGVFLAKMYLLNNTFIEGQCSPVTMEQAKESSSDTGIEIKQEHLDIGNKFSAINGFREFVRMMDVTAW